ncbi:MAG: DNA ligase D, partial [Pirellulales bacterium]
VGQVEFSSWTDDGRLRHPSFQGLREDKPAAGVVRDDAREYTAAPTGPKAKAVAHVGGRAATKQKRAIAVKQQKAAAEISENVVAGIRLTHPERLLYPEQGVTKLGLAAFYAEIADWILPHVVGRPLSLLRCPEGRRKTCFFQKHLDASAPDALARITIQEKNKPGHYAAVRDISGIVALVQMGVLEIHLWGSRADHVEKPDRLVFDLDPDEGTEWSRIVTAAERVRDALNAFDLESFLKTSGGKGLHVVVPIVRRHEWPQIKAFCKGVAQRISLEEPERYTINPLKARRVGRIFIDYLRNERGATAVAAYSTRAREGAPVSVPIDWSELKKDLRADHFNVDNLPARLNQLRRDPWADLMTTRQSITTAALKAVAKSIR